MAGSHRGVSVFDKHNPRLTHFDWYRIPHGTKIPDALAVTRDSASKTSMLPIHYTITPKDDMPLPLFLQHLKTIGAQAIKA